MSKHEWVVDEVGGGAIVTPEEIAAGWPVERLCPCADPENCTQTVPSYRCRKQSRVPHQERS